MTAMIGLRREDKSEWERRVPITPQDAVKLQREHGIQVIAQTSPMRAFTEPSSPKRASPSKRICLLPHHPWHQRDPEGVL